MWEWLERQRGIKEDEKEAANDEEENHFKRVGFKFGINDKERCQIEKLGHHLWNKQSHRSQLSI